MTILVVDDEIAIRDVVLGILADAGYTTTSAANGREALDCLRQHSAHINLILLDVMMPYLSGWDVLDARRLDPRLAVIPVILTTAGSDVQHKAATYEGTHYLPKPLDIDLLLALVAQYAVISVAR